MMKLILANKNYSSWSMRAWLFLKESNVDFEEKVIGLFSTEWKEKIKTYSPVAKAPILLLQDGTAIWDSLAIMSFVRQHYSSALQLPTETKKCALALSLTAEMHSGFLGIRNQLPMNLKKTVACPKLDDDTVIQVDRVREIWSQCLSQYGGPWLLGEFSQVDIMYAPVVTRFQTYGIEVEPQLHSYMQRLRDRQHVQTWTEQALRETHVLPFFDELADIRETPITPG